MNEQDNQGDGSPDEERVLHAFGELPPERAAEIERSIDRDPGAHVEVNAMRGLARQARTDQTGPGSQLLVATRGSIAIALRRQRRLRRIRTSAAIGAVAAAAIVIVVNRWPYETQSASGVADGSKAATSLPMGSFLSDADRQAVRQTVIRLYQEQDWQDSLEDQVGELRQRVSAVRSALYRNASTPRRYDLLKEKTEQLIEESTEASKTSRPSGSSRGRDDVKEDYHA